MRVLEADAGRQMRGGQWQVLYLLRGLRAAGIEATLAARHDSPLAERAGAEGVRVEPLGLAALSRLEKNADLIHAHDARSHTLALACSKPLVVSRRVAFPIGGSIASRFKYGRACRYLAVSEHVRSTLIDARVPFDKIALVYDGVPAAAPSDDERDLVVSPDFDDPMKGADLVREASKLSGIAVHFSRDLARDLARARLFVYITHQEGLGSGVLHAMAAGVPVIASRVGGLPEAVEDGVGGLLVENEAAAIARAMRSLIDDPARAQALSVNALRRFEERFTLARMIDRTVSVYQEALACRKS